MTDFEGLRYSYLTISPYKGDISKTDPAKTQSAKFFKSLTC